jgi:hypothetical protein
MTHRAVSDNAPRLEAFHHHRHRVLARMVSLRTVRRQWQWTGRSSVSRVRGATLPLWDIALGRAGRPLDHAAGAGSQCVRRDVRIWFQVSAALLVPLQWVHRCSPQWARWRRLHQDHKNVLASSAGDGNQRRTCRLFRSCLLVEPFFRLIFSFTLYMFFLRPPLSRSSTTTSQSVGPSICSLTCCSYSLCVCFHYFPPEHGSQLLFYSLPLLYVADKDVKLPPCFSVHHCCRGFFSPLKYI